MIFSGLNSERISFLFRTAVEAVKLKQFLDESRLRLMTLGAQYHRRKRGVTEDIGFMIRLPAAAEPIVRTWFRNELDCTPTLQPEALVAQFQAIERENIKIPHEQMRDFACQGIAYLMSDEPPSLWLDFLKSEIGGGAQEDGDDYDKPQEVRLSLEDVIDGFEKAGGAVPADDTSLLFGVLAALQSGDVAEANRRAASVTNPAIAARLSAAIARHGEAAAKSRVVVKQPIQFAGSGDIDLPDIELIGLSRPRSSDDSPAFIRVVAFRHEDAVYSLGDDQLINWLDNQYEIIAFPNSRNVRLPKGIELAAWVAEKFSTPQAIKVRVTRNGRPLYTTVPLSVERNQPDSIRDAIRQSSVPAGARPVFLLTDGSAVRLSSDVVNPSEHDFEEPLEWFRQLPSWEIVGRRIALGPLPPPDDFIDCSDISSVLKRILRSREAQAHLPKMTQAQIQGLVNSLKAEPGGLTLMRIERVHQSLSKFAESAVRLSTVVPELLATPDVRAEVDEAKKAILAEFVAEQSKARAERDRLTKEIGELNKKRATVEDEIKDTATEVRKSVRKSFEKAREAGMSTLGEVAVLSAILGSRESPERSGSPITRREITARGGNLAADLGALGAAMVEAKAAELFVTSLLAEGLPILIRGPLAGHYGQAIAAALSIDRAIVVEIPLGVVDGAVVAALVADIHQGDAVVFTGFNLSPYESYGASITDRIIRNLSGQPGRGPHVIFAAVDAPIGLPVPGDVGGLAAMLDTRWMISGTEREGAPEQGRQLLIESGNVLRTNALSRVATSVAAMADPFRRIANAFLARQGLQDS